jgi:5-formyltetrahydrofolate cyclo-ligase
MAQERNKEALLGALCASVRAFVTYQPLRTEVSLDDYVTPGTGVPVYTIAPRASLDPHEEVARAQDVVGDLPCVIFMPGRKFDAHGTRLGQGGGWYDRFLAKSPVEWIRVGFCFDYQFSATPLQRQPWDEPVDVVFVLNKETGVLSCTETRARMPAFLGN